MLSSKIDKCLELKRIYRSPHKYVTVSKASTTPFAFPTCIPLRALIPSLHNGVNPLEIKNYIIQLSYFPPLISWNRVHFFFFSIGIQYKPTVVKRYENNSIWFSERFYYINFPVCLPLMPPITPKFGCVFHSKKIQLITGLCISDNHGIYRQKIKIWWR